MFPREITYKTYDGQTVKRTFWFGITGSEIAEMKLTHRKDLVEYFNRIAAVDDRRELILLYKGLIEEAVGIREGEFFLKARNDENVRRAFFSTLAYDTLFLELIQSDDHGAKFLAEMFPEEFIAEWQEERNKTYTDEELLELPEPEFREVAGDWKDMDPHMHGIAMRRQELRRNNPERPRHKKPKYKGKPGGMQKAS